MTQTRNHKHCKVLESKINWKHLNRTSDKRPPLLQMAAGRFGFARSQEQNVWELQCGLLYLRGAKFQGQCFFEVFSYVASGSPSWIWEWTAVNGKKTSPAIPPHGTTFIFHGLHWSLSSYSVSPFCCPLLLCAPLSLCVCVCSLFPLPLIPPSCSFLILLDFSKLKP